MWYVFISLPCSLATYVPLFDKEISREATPAGQGCSPENQENGLTVSFLLLLVYMNTRDSRDFLDLGKIAKFNTLEI